MMGGATPVKLPGIASVSSSLEFPDMSATVPSLFAFPDLSAYLAGLYGLGSNADWIFSTIGNASNPWISFHVINSGTLYTSSPALPTYPDEGTGYWTLAPGGLLSGNYMYVLAVNRKDTSNISVTLLKISRLATLVNVQTVEGPIDISPSDETNYQGSEVSGISWAKTTPKGIFFFVTHFYSSGGTDSSKTFAVLMGTTGVIYPAYLTGGKPSLEVKPGDASCAIATGGCLWPSRCGKIYFSPVSGDLGLSGDFTAPPGHSIVPTNSIWSITPTTSGITLSEDVATVHDSGYATFRSICGDEHDRVFILDYMSDSSSKFKVYDSTYTVTANVSLGARSLSSTGRFSPCGFYPADAVLDNAAKVWIFGGATVSDTVIHPCLRQYDEAGNKDLEYVYPSPTDEQLDALGFSEFTASRFGYPDGLVNEHPALDFQCFDSVGMIPKIIGTW